MVPRSARSTASLKLASAIRCRRANRTTPLVRKIRTEPTNLPLADAIDDALLKHGIPAQSVRHLLFIFSGNAPEALLTASLHAYPGPFNQWGVGLHVEGHAAFIGAVYDRVIADANNA